MPLYQGSAICFWVSKERVQNLSTRFLQARILEWVAMPSSRGSSYPGIEPKSPAMQMDSLPSEPPVKPKNTGVGSLSLLQRIFLTQESNQGLLHCRWILYQLSYQENPSADTESGNKVRVQMDGPGFLDHNRKKNCVFLKCWNVCTPSSTFMLTIIFVS